MEDHSLAEAKKVQSLSKSPAELLPSATSLLPYRLNRRRTSLKLQLKRYFYLALPHVSLIIVSLAYTCLGAFVFMKLEEPHMRQLRKQMDLQVQTDKDQLLARLLELSRSRRSKEEGEVEFRNYVRSIYGMHKIKGLRERENLHYGDAPLGGGHPDRDRLLDPAEEWSFAAALFFVLTTLTTIGYGDVVPMTREGRVFCLCYCIIGIPLVLVTTANMAKFMSAGVYFVYVKYVLLREKIFRTLAHLKQSFAHANVETAKVSLEADQMLLQHLETVEYVRLSAPVILLIIVGYAALGGVIISHTEAWNFFDSFYFSLVSILTVGFGDFVPSQKRFIIVSMMYIFVGLLIATMCVDTVGVQYVQRIHQFGRRIRNADYHQLLRRLKARQFSIRENFEQFTESAESFSPEIEGVEADLPNDHSLPLRIRVADVTPYSIALKWSLQYEKEPDDGADVEYKLDYKTILAGARDKMTHSLITKQTECILENLCSFTAYSINMTLSFGKKKFTPINLLIVTEPETSPQNITIKAVDSTTAFLRWSPPCKNRDIVKAYAIYYSNNLPMAFESWQKKIVPAEELSSCVTGLENPDDYYFCMSSVYETYHSPLSKPICISENPTVKPEFLTYSKIHLWSWTPIFGYGKLHKSFEH
uniref:Fibronectin type-III domain-containing protein n=1 Tax=Trichuris muris TaxID=70415 RepID=A0A5S6Q8G6_TRIMR